MKEKYSYCFKRAEFVPKTMTAVEATKMQDSLCPLTGKE